MRPPCPDIGIAAGLLLLHGCGGEPGEPVGSSTSRTPEVSPGSLPASASAAWLATAVSGIASDAGAIHQRDGTFVADLGAVGLVARFDADRVVIGGDQVDLSVSTTAWGRVDAMRPVEAREPGLGASIAGPGAGAAGVRRLEYAGVDVTEWWVGQSTGLEQGWTVDVAPPGDALLAVDVAIEGAFVVDGGDDPATIVDARGRVWSVDGIDAWDAEGEPLPARLRVDSGGFRVEVDDEGAAYPIEIDPVYTTAATTLAGVAHSSFGRAVSGIGDVNHDGYEDVAVGAYEYSANTGRVYVYHGSSAGLSSTAATTLTGFGTSDFGWAVAGAGDVNNDGYDDVVVGAWYSGGSTGRAFVYHGSAGGLSTTPATTLNGTASSELGFSVSGAGDVNHDGYDDVIVGAEGYGGGVGRAYVYHGGSSGVSTTPATTLDGAAAFSYFGNAVSGAGDVNNDGYDDVIVGADGYSASLGRAYVYHGGAAGVSTSATTTLTGFVAFESFAESVANAGDVNADGYDDVIVGAPAPSSVGHAYVYPGGASGVSTSIATTLTGGTDTYFGWSVSGAGDVNADGYDDVIVGAMNDGGAAGRIYVYPGATGGVSSTAVSTLTGSAGSEFGFSVSTAGDVNGDGYDDVVVGADYYGGGTGRAYVYRGYADEDGDGILSLADCDDLDASVGAATMRYLDADGDGWGTTSTGAACPDAVGFASSSTDCDDAAPTVHPGAAEVCDASNTDEDCDGVADDADASATGQTTFYLDADGDGYGGTTTAASCDLRAGYALDSLDCDDASGATHPGAAETCDGVDEDCDGVVDDGLDCVAPSSASVQIDAGAPYTNDADVTLDLSATDNVSVTEMCVATTPTCTMWLPYTTTLTLTLGTGAQTVYAWFRDAAGLVSARAQDDIVVDLDAPTQGTMSAVPVNGGVTLSWSGFGDLGSGITSYAVVRANGTTSPASCSSGEATYAGSATTTTVSGLVNGSLYSFRLCATDGAGNQDDGVTVTTYAGRDRVAPTGGVSVNADALWTRTIAVSLTLAASDDRGVTSMCISNTPACTAYESYATSKSWVLARSGTPRVVYVKYRDAAGNVSMQASDSIQFDGDRPTDGMVTGSGGSDTVTCSGVDTPTRRAGSRRTRWCRGRLATGLVRGRRRRVQWRGDKHDDFRTVARNVPVSGLRDGRCRQPVGRRDRERVRTRLNDAVASSPLVPRGEGRRWNQGGSRLHPRS